MLIRAVQVLRVPCSTLHLWKRLGRTKKYRKATESALPAYRRGTGMMIAQMENCREFKGGGKYIYIYLKKPNVKMRTPRERKENGH